MFQSSIPHHETGTFKSRRTFLKDEEYGVALDNLVKGCSDVLLISPCGSKIFCGRRCVQPQPDWWFVGGRMFPGETPVDSARRLLKREIGLDVEAARFRSVCAQSFAFGTRQQKPEDHGTTDAQFALRLKLKEEEVSKVVLDPMEYAEWGWKTPDEILGGNFHPALKYATSAYLATERYDEMKQIIEGGGTDEEVAKAARALVARANMDEVVRTNEYKLVSEELKYECTVTTRLDGVQTPNASQKRKADPEV